MRLYLLKEELICHFHLFIKYMNMNDQLVDKITETNG